jgi:propanediol dehydratase small subunit
MISEQTLLQQAAAAESAGFAQLAENFRRAAELTRVPNADLLRMYELLRPGRSTEAQLSAMADELETVYAAPISAAWVREAVRVYRERGLYRNTEREAASIPTRPAYRP